MAANSTGNGGRGVDVRVTLTPSQADLLDALTDGDGPFDDRNEAMQYIIDEYEGLSVREPVRVE